MSLTPEEKHKDTSNKYSEIWNIKDHVGKN